MQKELKLNSLQMLAKQAEIMNGLLERIADALEDANKTVI